MTPTHFTESSNSLIDVVIFVTNTNHILTSFVADSLIPGVFLFHFQIVSAINFSKPKGATYKRKIWLYDRGDISGYINEIY
jgi:hypothetical protein